ncbi:transglycosylase domain-containing protein [Aliicoccus persicus]|uniref:Penicillin-binding protein 1A n=1 Tax=Aliicoccus persicus TaxID=930138 RepID=A0A662Z0T6_9STAP|nr:transglycosylase domain-containing protein [Aliicoccus persicus]SEV83390.1 penicillin-binding protein 1A [Aliicoccus persicus]
MTENNESTNNQRTSKHKFNYVTILKRAFLISILLGLILLMFGTFLFAYYSSNAPTFTDEKLNDPVPSRVFDVNNNFVFEIHQEQPRELIEIESLPDDVKDAVLAVEDNRFYDHGAIDFIRLGASVIRNFQSGFGAEGGSTITQQVVKRVFLTDDKSLERKAQEAYLAYRLEQEYTKDDILEMYLNKIYYSDGIYGIRTASMYYFNKELHELNLAETAYLAGLPQLPNIYNLYIDSESGINRAHTVLYLMNYHGRISDEQYEEALAIDITANLVPRTEEERIDSEPDNPEYAAYIDLIREEIDNSDAFGEMSSGDVLASGVDIYTNMNVDAQLRMYNITNNRQYFSGEKFASDNFDMGAILLDTKTGGVAAVSGGRDYREIVKHNMATYARNVGSTMKPFLSYAPAIEYLQLGTGHLIQDEESYSPVGTDGMIYNYDGQNHGNVTMRTSVLRSFNIPSVKIFEQVVDEVGTEGVMNFASEVGLNYSHIGDGNYEVNFNDVLGGSESRFSPREMAEAYRTFGNNGEYGESHAIRSIVTLDEQSFEFENETHQAMEDYTAYMMTDMMKHTFYSYGTAANAYINGLNLAGKTGTTSYDTAHANELNLPNNSGKDAWIVGYTPEYTMSVWMGFHEDRPDGESSFVGGNEQIMPQWFFRDVMANVSSYNGEDFTMPESVRWQNSEIEVNVE